MVLWRIKNKVLLTGFTNKFDILGEFLSATTNAARALESKMKKLNLQISADKVKIIKLSGSG